MEGHQVMENLKMVTEDQLYCDSCFAAGLVDSSFEHTDMHRKQIVEIFFLFVFYLSPICYFYEPKRPSHLPIIIVIIIIIIFFC